MGTVMQTKKLAEEYVKILTGHDKGRKKKNYNKSNHGRANKIS